MEENELQRGKKYAQGHAWNLNPDVLHPISDLNCFCIYKPPKREAAKAAANNLWYEPKGQLSVFHFHVFFLDAMFSHESDHANVTGNSSRACSNILLEKRDVMLACTPF